MIDDDGWMRLERATVGRLCSRARSSLATILVIERVVT